MKHVNVALDGPAGAGKSTIARQAAADLGLLYVDTGAIYRTAAVAVTDRGADPKDPDAVAALLPSLRIQLSHGADGLQRMSLNGEDVTERIRLPEISAAASAVAVHPAVRAFLLEAQRALAREHSVIMDGRDIGTVVLPGADVKIFLTASAQERARRRTRELNERGTPRPYEEILLEMTLRDAQDANRETAPLRQAEDAVRLDTTALTLPESVEAVERIIRERTGLS